jgi:oligopeptide/dipeptide ABC transporter ATP-binding protein
LIYPFFRSLLFRLEPEQAHGFTLGLLRLAGALPPLRAMLGALFAAPRHPYTARLMSSTPDRGSTLAGLVAVPGQLPDLRRADLPACRFLERCERASDRCRTSLPVLDPDAPRSVACWHPLTQAAPAAFAAEPGIGAATR